MSAAGRDTLFHRENAEEIRRHSTVSHPPKRGEWGKIGGRLGSRVPGPALRLRLAPSSPSGLEKNGTGLERRRQVRDTFVIAAVCWDGSPPRTKKGTLLAVGILFD